MDIFANLTLLFVIVGAGLILAEAAIPGAHFIVLGVAMFLAGLVGMVLPASIASPFILALLTLVFGSVAFWVYKNFDLYGPSQGQTKSSTDLVGKEGVVIDRVTPAEGRVDLNNVTGFSSTFSARCDAGEIPPETPVIVTDGRGGNVVTVEEFTEE